MSAISILYSLIVPTKKALDAEDVSMKGWRANLSMATK